MSYRIWFDHGISMVITTLLILKKDSLRNVFPLYISLYSLLPSPPDNLITST